VLYPFVGICTNLEVLDGLSAISVGSSACALKCH
jgi:hypothetical protein